MSASINILEEDNKAQEEIIRFMQDLEFVQCLANPYYLKYLSNMGYFDDENFVNYLQYLLYFKKAEYMKYITFERCIIFLELLQYKNLDKNSKKKIMKNQLIFFCIKIGRKEARIQIMKIKKKIVRRKKMIKKM